MSVDQLLEVLTDRGIMLSLNGDRLKYRSPSGSLTADIRAAISQHRQTIITLLATQRNGKANGRTDCIHVFRENWVDATPENGRIRTTCRICGGFIGYRPTG